VSIRIVNRLNLKLRSLVKIRFQSLFIKTTNYKETILYYWIIIKLGVKEVWRTIKYFVAFNIKY